MREIRESEPQKRKTRESNGIREGREGEEESGEIKEKVANVKLNTCKEEDKRKEKLRD